MQILQTYNQNVGFTEVINLANTTLTVSRTFFANGFNANTTDTQTFDLENVITNYAEDHGCIALGFSAANNLAPMQWCETSRLTMPVRTPLYKTYSSLLTGSDAKQSNGAISYNEGYDQKNILNGSKHNASSPSWAMAQFGLVPILYICTPYIGCTLDECTLIYRSTITAEQGNTYVTFINNGTTLDPKTVPDSKSLKKFLIDYLPITFAGPNTAPANSTVQYTVTANTKANLYLSTTAGVINRNVCTNGQIVTLKTTGLVAGDIVELSGGYKLYPNASKFTITIT